MQYFPAIMLGMFLLLVFTRPFTVLFHELGHALPGMLFTRQGATIYVGSYGNEKQSFKISLGKLTIWFRYNPLGWKGGLCILKSADMSVNQQTIFCLGGPLFSFLVAASLFYITFILDLHGSIKLVCAFGLGSTFIDLFGNLIPRQMELADGSTLNSDGYHFAKIKKLKKFEIEYIAAHEMYDKKEYEKSGILLQRLIDKKLANQDIYARAYTSQMFIKNYNKALLLLKEFESKYQLASDDYFNWGMANWYMKLKEETSLCFQKSLRLNPDNVHTLNAVGYVLTTCNKFQEALPYFEKAINLDPQYSYAYNNRGYVQIEIGQIEEGLNDINHSISLNKENSYAFRNLGIYHLYRNEKEKALTYFIKAQEMDQETDLILDLIIKAKALEI